MDSCPDTWKLGIQNSENGKLCVGMLRSYSVPSIINPTINHINRINKLLFNEVKIATTFSGSHGPNGGSLLSTLWEKVELQCVAGR
jgi:hypothetical protein